MPRLNSGVQGSPIVTTVLPKDRLTNGVAGSPVFVGPVGSGVRRSPGVAGSPRLFSATWYLDTNDGNDGNPGTAPESPVKTWGSLSGKGLKTGHTIKVKNNSVVPLATMYADGLIIEAYGDTGAAPVIESIDENGFTEPTVAETVTVQAPGIPTSGLVAAWDLTGYSAVQQSIAGAHGTSYALQSGSTSGVDGDDPISVTTAGMQLTDSGANDFLTAPTVPDTDLLGAISLVVVMATNGSTNGPIISKAERTLGELTPTPFAFMLDVSGNLYVERGGSGARLFTGPATVATADAFRMYSVVCPSGIQNAPSFFVGTTKTTGTDTAGTGTGSASGTSNPFRVGVAPVFTANNGTTRYSYIFVYSRALSDAEISNIYAVMQTHMQAVAVTLP